MGTLKLYNELAKWWPLLSPPENYLEEAMFYLKLFQEADPLLQTMVEFGCGGGSNAFHLKQYFKLALSDISAGMLEHSQKLNPECEHFVGDMRTMRLGREFDAVFIHDAIMYMTTEDDLRQAMETAYVHCRPGGMAMFVPDNVRETFEPETKCGGEDGEDRALRYIEWSFDPDPSDTTFEYHLTYLLREGDLVHVEHDPHIVGLFGREDWLRLLREVGFEPRIVLDPFDREIFLGNRPT